MTFKNNHFQVHFENLGPTAKMKSDAFDQGSRLLDLLRSKYFTNFTFGDKERLALFIKISILKLAVSSLLLIIRLFLIRLPLNLFDSRLKLIQVRLRPPIKVYFGRPNQTIRFRFLPPLQLAEGSIYLLVFKFISSQ